MRRSEDPAAGHPAGRRILGFVRFQVGPVRNYGRNGLTETALISVLIDRLEGHQEGTHPSPHNALALDHLRVALDALNSRTADRVARGVEGTNRA